MSEWITIKEFCEKTKKDRGTYYNWVNKGMPTHKIQGSVMLDTKEIDDWIRQRKVIANK